MGGLADGRTIHIGMEMDNIGSQCHVNGHRDIKLTGPCQKAVLVVGKIFFNDLARSFTKGNMMMLTKILKIAWAFAICMARLSVVSRTNFENGVINGKKIKTPPTLIKI